MDFSFLGSISILLAFSILVLLICYRFKIPEIIGFLVTGVLAGPHVFGIISNTHDIDYFAEIGVVLLLFTIGMEFSFKKLIELKKELLIGGVAQVLFTFLVSFVVASMLGLSFNTSVLIGFLISLSSTAIVLRLLQDRDELETPHGRIILGILIFQDIVAVPMMLLIPLLTGKSGDILSTIPLMMIEVVAVIFLVIVCTVWIVPKVLQRVAQTRSQELFLLSVVVLCLAMAWLTQSIGLSLALGAFLAGLIISESQFSHQALGGILPFRYVFTSIFFVSIGMMLDISFFLSHPAIIVAAVIGIILIKALMGGAATLALGYPMRTIVIVGLALSQVGEFSFILSKIGADSGLLTADQYQFFLAASILTMGATPFILNLSPKTSDFICSLPLPTRLKANNCPVKEEAFTMKDHLVIIGYGLNGRNLSRAARASRIPYVIIEMNPDTVVVEKAKGELIFYGDATNDMVLEHARVAEARTAVIAISDSIATRRIVHVLRSKNPRLHIIVRTRYLKEMKSLYELGANEVIPEEFETSVEIFARVLKKYLVPKSDIDRLTTDVRSENYEMFRNKSKTYTLEDLGTNVPEVEISTIVIKADTPVCNQSIKDIELRKKYGVTIVLIQRGLETIYNPGADTTLLDGDTVFLFGSHDRLAGATGLFSEQSSESARVSSELQVPPKQ
ncbi:monovalent cation:proton antiporter-2 (CPA2) family protein [Methanocella sp. MCL-LM]|uniref:monovalent cation:proton antiporter-2 (CPA2) family protein n=1 Tax=Methanocella sp. MCL-LM TaxID=3412035 RepID=UPI003C766C7B